MDIKNSLFSLLVHVAACIFLFMHQIYFKLCESVPSYLLGMLGTSISSNSPGVVLSLEQGDLAAKPSTDPSAGIYSSQLDSDNSPRPHEAKVSHTLNKY